MALDIHQMKGEYGILTVVGAVNYASACGNLTLVDLGGLDF